MSKVLLIDGNPDHVRSLAGLFKYRTKHSLTTVGACVAGLRCIYADMPDVILINALLFASEDYAFPRALAEDSSRAGSRFVVLFSGRQDEIRERSVEKYGAIILELPTSAGELNEAIDKAGRLKTRTTDPEAVNWAQTAEPAEPKPEADDQPTVQRVVWQPIEKPAKFGVRAVDWAVDGGRPAKSQSSSPKPRTRKARHTAPRPKIEEVAKSTVFKGGAEAFLPAFTSGEDGFRSKANKAEQVDAAKDEGPQPFKPSKFENLSGADPKRIKNR